jgi:outer membrane protein assembly factor BamB
MFVACAGKFKIKEGQLESASPWPYHRGTETSVGAYHSSDFTGKLIQAWKAKSSGKPNAPLTIYDNVLVYPDSRKRIRFFDVLTGRYLGKLKTKGPPQTAVSISDSKAFLALAPRRNRVEGYDLTRGKRLWKRPIKDASFGSIIVNDRLIIGSGEGLVVAVDLDDGSELWRFEGEGKFVAPPSYLDNRVYQPSDKGILYALSATDGEELYRVILDGPLVNSVAVGELVFVADMIGTVYGIDPLSGDVKWRRKLNADIWTAPAVKDGRVFVAHSGAELVALDAVSGKILWRSRINQVLKASPLVLGDVVIVGTMGGKLITFHVENGEVIDQVELKGAIAYPPVTDGNRVMVATQAGEIVCYGEANEEYSTSDK